MTKHETETSEAMPAPPNKALAALMGHVNEMSQELKEKKLAVSVLLAEGLVDATSVVEDNGEKLPFDRLYGRLEGREEALNAVAAFAITLSEELKGKINPDLA